MRFLARLLGGVTTGGWLLFGVTSALALRPTVEKGLLHMLLPGAALLLAYLSAWQWPIFGGILLLIDGLIVLVLPAVRNDPFLIGLFAAPVVLSGLFFLFARREPRKGAAVRRHILPASAPSRELP